MAPKAPPKAVPAAPKAPPAAPVAAAPIPQSAADATSPYQIEIGGPPPERTRSFGGVERTPSPFKSKMQELPLPEGNNYGQFFAPIDDIDPAITDGAEIEKAGKEAQRKLTNNLGGIARRIKKDDASYVFTMRETIEKYQGKDNVRGVRVWRIAPVETQEAAQ